MRNKYLSLASNAGSPLCCGFDEISGLSGGYSPETYAIDLLTFGHPAVPRGYGEEPRVILHHPQRAHLLFTQAYDVKREFETKGYGFEFKEYIEREKLGTVIHTHANRNPNSGNYVVAFLWSLNPEGIQEWFNRNKERINKVVAQIPLT